MTLSRLRLYLLLLLQTSLSTIPTTNALETLMQDFPAFTSAAETRPCATECAIVPSATFKVKYSCSPGNPVSCICANETASVELRDSMSTYCYNKCDGLVGPRLATAILADYCGQDWEGKATITKPPEGPTTTPAAPKGGGPNTEDSDGGLKRWETIVIGTLVPIGIYD
ncbi:hypothetical protein B0T18DRAFT_433001 [Schizothecium vesticola]|uniref:Extracellular membrane protein CFEM domain-containing protein n=1 Tax=Schizothecium vesticola TaxID=314040 RepID=A0AA40BPX6_9PEZI|nr:hypothetical protein B0T18DRAFT_433001 [Schizothecium vesticola]